MTISLELHHTITDKEAIRKAKNMPKSVPLSILEPLVPIGMAKFKGDKMPPNWSLNDQFEVGKEYPVYETDEDVFVVGKDGQGKKMLPVAWGKINKF